MTYKTKVREAVLEKCASINRNTLWKGACPQPRQTSKFSVPVGLSFWRGQGDGIIFFLTSPLVCIHFLPNNILSYSIGISTISTLFSLSLSLFTLPNIFVTICHVDLYVPKILWPIRNCVTAYLPMILSSSQLIV